MPQRQPADGLPQMPSHVGIIMDGNGRWAKKHALPRNMGHRKGAEVFQKIASYALKLGIPYLTVYAFSTENWRRPQEEVNAIMRLLGQYLDEAFRHERDADARRIRLCFLGDRSPLPANLQEKIERIEKDSADNKGICVNIALNYGGRDEIVYAARALARRCIAGELCPKEITEELFSKNLFTAGQPDPDLIIRPSGEYRTSNFLPWQSVYAELVFMDVLWPDFTEKDFDRALEIFRSRSRRFGGL